MKPTIPREPEIPLIKEKTVFPFITENYFFENVRERNKKLMIVVTHSYVENLMEIRRNCYNCLPWEKSRKNIADRKLAWNSVCIQGRTLSGGNEKVPPEHIQIKKSGERFAGGSFGTQAGEIFQRMLGFAIFAMAEKSKIFIRKKKSSSG
ncbi:hypothetical protein NPIL_367201 [Nephila pilipes]|uniref:Uncharacterized protein n=1 Tax=Nephila pilipes TaxID=299642 RepID=A0A8X6TBC2_NEPPI|nr:hypothetical protein NPIL_367201 [Nephila pilipes]